MRQQPVELGEVDRLAVIGEARRRVAEPVLELVAAELDVHPASTG